eukprot:Em0004g382a
MAEDEADLIEIDMAELKKMKVADLKKKVTELGLEAGGTKAELLAKVEKYLSEQDADLLEGEEESGEGHVNSKEVGGDPEGEGEGEGEEDEEEEEEEGAEGKDNPSEQSPQTISDAAKGNPPAESISSPKATATPAATPTAAAVETVPSSSDSTVPVTSTAVPTAQPSHVEKLKMRAEKFGSNESELAKKLARAERFGTATNDILGQGVNVDVLKKRAERFGVAVAPVLAKVELDERKRHRLERFGTDISSPELTVHRNNILVAYQQCCISSGEKKKRLERFGAGAQ